MDPIVFFRWLHILSGAAWLGEVVTINVVLLPSLRSIEPSERPRFIRTTFPRLFRLASVLSLLSISSGFVMSYLVSGWKDPSIFIDTRWGLSILIGGSLGVALTTFHFFVESKLEPIASALNEDSDEEELERVIRFLRTVPRAGLLVMIIIFTLMMIAARGV
jgi:uncharacterized membrane protein